MVRAIAGSLVEVGRGRWPAGQIGAILASKDRSQAGPTAPPHGLFLVSVRYC
jgi:tRNA pseudouridine38-40 synthase